MGKRHRQHQLPARSIAQNNPKPLTPEQALAKSGPVARSASSPEPSSGQGGRCPVCGGKVNGVGAPGGIPWNEGTPWPMGSFRAHCRNCGGHCLVLTDATVHSLEGIDQWKNLIPEVPETIRARMKQREELPTFVCVGTSPDSAGLVPWDEPGIIGFAALNDCHVLPFLRPEKITEWYQLHHRWRFTRRNPRYGQNDHWAWLQEKHDFPIYMQKKYDDVPSSTPFPLKEITEKYLACRLGRGNSFQRMYYTCSFSYILPHILDMFEKKYMPSDYNPLHDPPYARIEFYGIELAQKQEYIEQRPGTEFWSGICMGRGIQFYVPDQTRIFHGEIYGYRVPDRNGAINQIRAMYPQGISSAQAIAMAVGENLPDENNIGSSAWKNYPDEKYALEYPNMTEDDWAMPELEMAA